MIDEKLWEDTECLMIDLGFNVYYKGFYYLRDAVQYQSLNEDRKLSLNKEVYERIADDNSVSKESVEKCIRYVLSKAWEVRNHRLRKECKRLMGASEKKPSNGQIIQMLSSLIRLERAQGF